MKVVSEIVKTLPFEEYSAHPGLSYSGMKDLAVSPLRYWHKWINPERQPEEPTPEMKLGTALHCAVLERNTFEDRYCSEVVVSDYPECLITMDDMRSWMLDRGVTPKGKHKADLISQVQTIDPGMAIFDVIKQNHLAENDGKTILRRDDWERVTGMAKALLDEPRVQELLSSGDPEVSWFSIDQESGVHLKARMDWVATSHTADLKTFTQKRGKSIDKSVADAILYEGYNRQATFYSIVRGWPEWTGDFVIPFVESEPPYEVRIRALRAKTAGQPNLYWNRALLEIREMIRLYAECWEHFGTRPWRYAQEVNVLVDEELPGMAY